MRTLRQQGEFVGMPQDSLEYGTPPPRISLRLMADLAAQANGGQPVTSMRALDQILDGLPPITLDAERRSPSHGREPLEVVIRVNPGTGLIISTRITYMSQTGEVFSTYRNYGAYGGDIREEIGPGYWTVTVHRRGVGATGFVTLQKQFTVRAEPLEPDPPPPPPQQQRPRISVTSEGPPEATTFTITGTGFLPNQPDNAYGIAIRAVDGVGFEWIRLFTSSDATGAIRYTTGALDTRQLPRDAAGLARVHFSATDKRTDPTSTPANEPLWSNTVTFTF